MNNIKVISYLDPKCPKNTGFNNWWYFHGELEKLLGYDKGVFLNLKDYPTLTRETLRTSVIVGGISRDNCIKLVKEPYLEGKFNISVEGLDKPCTGIFWITNKRRYVNIDSKGNNYFYYRWNQEGYVYLNSDKEAEEFINKEYDRNT